MEGTTASASRRSHGGNTLAPEATVRELFSKDLAGDAGRELSMIAVEYPPGSADPMHTHHAQALVYVLLTQTSRLA
jgi:quercetin dioxygenase-like cupin family protein